MQSSSESLWSEIKKYEDQLQNDPSSYCFATLADLYITAGMLDDALTVSRAGASKHPGYVAGQMALARACHKKGLLDECRIALEVVTAAVPEQAEAQRMLVGLYRESGRLRDAERSLQILMNLCPDDALAAELAAVRRSIGFADDDDDLELIELTEDDIYEDPEDDQLVERIKPPVALVEDPWAAIAVTEDIQEHVPAALDAAAIWALPEQQLAAAADEDEELEQDDVACATVDETSEGGVDPLTTATLAELYVSQGFPDKAAGIYRRIIAAEPGNAEALARLSELEKSSGIESVQAEVPLEVVPQVVQAVDLPANGSADKAATVAVLEGWLDNIRRLRTCR